MQRVEYRRAKKFKLDEDMEVADFFTGSAKNPIKADWNDYGGDKRNCQLHSSPINRLIQNSVGRKWDDVNSYFKRKIKNRTRYQQYSFNIMFKRWNRIERTMLVDGELQYVDIGMRWYMRDLRVKPGDLYIDPDGYVRHAPPDKKKRYRWVRENSKFSDPYGVTSVKSSAINNDTVYKQVLNEYRVKIGVGKFKVIQEYNWFKWTSIVEDYEERYWDSTERKYKTRPAKRDVLIRKPASKKEIRDNKLKEIE